MSLRILVTGSRAWPASAAHVVHEAIDDALLLASIGKHVLVHGACPDPQNEPWSLSVDMIADRYWCQRMRESGFLDQPERHPADWNAHGRSAGPIRNRDMVERGATVVLGFPYGRSAGTRGCMRLAREHGLDVWEYDALMGGRAR